MYRISIITILVLGLTVSVCLSQVPSTGLEQYLLTDAEKASLPNEALDGSGSAAYRLAMHYLMTPEGGGPGPALYWAQIGAENGNAECQNNYATLLLLNKNHTVQEERRAMFWLRLSAQQGNKNAKSQLEFYEKNSGAPAAIDKSMH